MGLFFKKEDKVSEEEAAFEEREPEEITPEIKVKLDELAERENQLEEDERYDEAVSAWKKALDLIPEPQQCYSETSWFLTAIGDVYFQQGMYLHMNALTRREEIGALKWDMSIPLSCCGLENVVWRSATRRMPLNICSGHICWRGERYLNPTKTGMMMG